MTGLQREREREQNKVPKLFMVSEFVNIFVESEVKSQNEEGVGFAREQHYSSLLNLLNC